MLFLNLVPVMKARGIERPYSFLIKAGFTSHTANLLLKPSVKALKLQHIEMLCIALKCMPHDLMGWRDEEGVQLPETHPLNELKKNDVHDNVYDILKALPLDQLREVALKLK